MKFQSDYSGHIRKDGCLLCEIVTQVELKVGREISDGNPFREFVKYLHTVPASWDPNYPVVSDESNIRREGSFVWDHAQVGNEACSVLGFTREKLVYGGRIYMPWEILKGKTSFGDRTPCDFVILQTRTPNGGHFRGANHDPWRPGTQMLDLKSIRYYYWVKR